MSENASCVFCKIIAGEIPARLIMQDEYGVVIADNAPKADIHWLVIPKRHITDLRACGPEDELIMDKLMERVRTVVRDHAGNKPFKLIVNNGYEAGQRVFHLHIHILAGTIHELI